MNSLAKVFSNFKEFYSEINGATLTGAIDVIVVQQPDESFMCSPFHVRFGKLGVLRSREKVVDIEINGEPVDIHMKLGESGEAFFVEECSDDDEDLPENLATSPIPTSEFSKYEEETNEFVNEPEIKIPIPRRNSIDLSKESEETSEKKFENQLSDFSYRRYTDNGFERPNLTEVKKEYTTQKIRKEWADHEETIHNLENLEDKENINITKDTQLFRPIIETVTSEEGINKRDEDKNEIKDDKSGKDELKSKKKRRKKSAKKKNSTRKNSTSSSAGSVHSEQPEIDHDTLSAVNNTGEQSSSTEESPISDETNDATKEADIKEEGGLLMSTSSRYRELDIHFFSDTEIGNTLSSPRGSRPSTPVQSDTEFEVSQREKDTNVMTNSASWKWGELPTHPEDIKENITDDSKQAQRNSMLSGMFSFMKQSKKMRKNVSEGLYLSDLNDEGMDPEVAALYLEPARRKSLAKSHAEMQQHTNEDDRESGNGTSLPQSPNSMEAAKNSDSDYEEGKITDKFADIVAMSLCGGLDMGGPRDEDFDSHLIQYSDVCQDPSLFASPSLVVRLNGRYYSWAAACPIVMTMITFQKPLPNDVVEVLMDRKLKVENIEIPSTQASAINPDSQKSYYRFFGGLLRRQNKSESSATVIPPSQIAMKEPSTPNALSGNELIPPVNTGTQTSRTNSPDLKSNGGETKENSSIPTSPLALTDQDLSQDLNNSSLLKNSNDKFRKTLRLSTQQIELLNLKDGMNEVVFSVTTAYQGTTRCKCYLFKWKHNDKVVISDIDGTITKSDVLGHLLPMVGKDWAQIGVAQLFSKIEENGYKLLYLSARAIGQSRATREYLRSIRQGDVKLPDGPLLLNPTSLISAFHREVIERKPEQFKIACLSDIQMLFPDKKPFYAGYGNRINDVWAYRAVGIPIMRIFTINTKGELKHELTQTFQSTYCSMAYIVDQLFPPVHTEDQEPASIEYSNFNYWRDPVCDIEDFVEEIKSGDEPPPPSNLNLSKTLSSIPEN